MFVFGETDLDSGLDKFIDAFEGSFAKAHCIASGEAVGAVPPTCTCLNGKQVHHEVGDFSDDTIQIEMMEMKRPNTMACDFLIAWRFQGHF